MSVGLVVGAATDVGQVRDHNEDAYLVDDALGLVAVADGMGGHQGGEVASATALEALRAAIASGDGIEAAVTSANGAVLDKSAGDQRLLGMGTTLTAGTLDPDGTLLVGHVGDSRAYLLRDGELTRVTTDHSVVEELIQSGELTAEQAELDPRRSQITRALGLEPGIDVDVYPVELRPGDRLLLCSDGLTGMVGEADITRQLQEEGDPNQAAAHLVEAANAAGGVDNVTAVVIDVIEREGEPVGVAPAPAEETADAALDEEPTEVVEVVGAPRRRWLRWLRWVLPLLVVLGLVIGGVAWYARNRYFVGTDLGLVTVYRGVPGGVLLWDPTIENRTSVQLEDLTGAQREAVRDDKEFSSREEADAYVRRLRADIERRTPSTTTTTTTTTTTPPPTTGPTLLPPAGPPA